MAHTYPYIQFYASDWMADTSLVSLQTRGFWIDLICVMHLQNRTGTITGTVEQIARACRCSEGEAETALKEISAWRLANVAQGNGKVTVTCRRMKKAENERKRIAAAVKKTKQKNKGNGFVTGILQHHISEGEGEGDLKELSLVPSLPPEPKKEEPPIPGKHYPESIDDVIRIAESPLCGMKCTREEADLYLQYRISRDWVPNGGRYSIRPGGVPADLKIWLIKKATEKQTTANRSAKYNAVDTKNITTDPSAFDASKDGSDY